MDESKVKIDSNETDEVDRPLTVWERLLCALLVWVKISPVVRLSLLMAGVLITMGIGILLMSLMI